MTIFRIFRAYCQTAPRRFIGILNRHCMSESVLLRSWDPVFLSAVLMKLIGGFPRRVFDCVTEGVDFLC